MTDQPRLKQFARMLIATVDPMNMTRVHAASPAGQGFVSPSDFIKLAANVGAERFVYGPDNRRPVTPWSDDQQKWHAI